MDNVLDLDLHRQQRAAAQESKASSIRRTADKFLRAQRIEKLTLQIDKLLEDKGRDEAMPEAVAMAAGRFAAMQLFRKHGRTQTLAFFEDCIQTAEICDDIIAQLEDDWV
jgi:Holliday junction resolvase-like predicted endonuclease